MPLDEFVAFALAQIDSGLKKVVGEGGIAIAYVHQVVFEVQVVPSSEDGLTCSRGDSAHGRLTFTVNTDAGVAPYPRGER